MNSAQRLRTKQAAAYLGVHEQTLRAWANRRLVPCVRIGTRGDRRFLLSDLDALLVERETPKSRGRHEEQP